MAQESITLPCSFAHHQNWGPSGVAQVHWRLGRFHSKRYLFICCQSPTHTDPEFQGRVSLARQEGQPYTAAIRITALRESDSQLYFCRVSMETRHGEQAWQTIHGTNLTVTGESSLSLFAAAPRGQKAGGASCWLSAKDLPLPPQS